jgi:hypothetical protein
MVMTAPMIKIAGLPLPERLCRQIADALTMLGLGKRNASYAIFRCCRPRPSLPSRRRPSAG